MMLFDDEPEDLDAVVGDARLGFEAYNDAPPELRVIFEEVS